METEKIPPFTNEDGKFQKKKAELEAERSRESQAGKSSKPVTREQVYEWTKRDISAASYFLSMLLRYPDIIQGVADQLYDRVMDEEQGALIEKVSKEKVEP